MTNARSQRFWLTAALLLALLFLASGMLLNRYIVKTEVEAYASKFELLSNLRRNALEDYFDTVSAELRFWSLSPQLLKSQRQIVDLWQQYQLGGGNSAEALRKAFITDNPLPAGRRGEYLGPEKEGVYIAFHQQFHPFASRFVTERGYYDLFMISPDGNIFYSVEKEDDYATNLINGAYHDTALARVFLQALARAADKNFVAFSDIEAYTPSNNDPAMFTAKALVDENGELLGVLALQLPMNKLRSIMGFTAGMGESGETYLVGEDLLMRSDSRFSETSTILKNKVDTTTVNRALAGESGAAFTPDYRGIEVLSAYTSLGPEGNRWAVMAEIDREEIIQQMANTRPKLAGALLFLYGLALWSLWFIKPGDWADSASLTDLGGAGDFGDGGQA